MEILLYFYPNFSFNPVIRGHYGGNIHHQIKQLSHSEQQDKETEKAQQKQRYLKKKEQSQLTTKQQSAKYYQAEAIKILMTFKEYYGRIFSKINNLFSNTC